MRSVKALWEAEWTKNPWLVKIKVERERRERETHVLCKRERERDKMIQVLCKRERVREGEETHLTLD